jgi:hypothetical protein
MRDWYGSLFEFFIVGEIVIIRFVVHFVHYACMAVLFKLEQII